MNNILPRTPSIEVGMAASINRDAMILADREPYINVTVYTIIPSYFRRERSIAIANPKSPILAIPSEVIHTLLGFRSRWMIPLE